MLSLCAKMTYERKKKARRPLKPPAVWTEFGSRFPRKSAAVDVYLGSRACKLSGRAVHATLGAEEAARR